MLGCRPRGHRWRRDPLLPRDRGTTARSDVPRPRRDSNTPVNAHAALAEAHSAPRLQRGDFDEYFAERDGAEKVQRDATNPHGSLDRLVDRVGEKGGWRSTVLGLSVPRALSGPGGFVTSVSTWQVVG